MKERRKFRRISKNVSIKLFSSEFDIVTETKNISGNGAYCAVNRPIPVMTKLNIIILLPFKRNENKVIKKINCSGVVVRGSYIRNNSKYSYCVGIYFNEINDKDRKIILSYIDTFPKSARVNPA
jgi:hypothetical protein